MEKPTGREVYRTPPGSSRKYCKQQVYTASSQQRSRRVRFYKLLSQGKSDCKYRVSRAGKMLPRCNLKKSLFFFYINNDFLNYKDNVYSLWGILKFQKIQRRK
jgi:hypothetical protein